MHSGQKLKTKFQRFRMVASVVCLGIALMQNTKAHQDPSGDIHPQVRVVDGKFSIIFNQSLPDEETDFRDYKPVQQMIYTAEGKLFTPRHSLEEKQSRESVGPVGLHTEEFKLGKSKLIFTADQSSYLIESPEGKITKFRFPWPDGVAPDLMDSVVLTPNGIAMTGKKVTEGMKEDPLEFYWFAHDSYDSPAVIPIGATECIYHFPVASNLVLAGGKIWMAYMRPTENSTKLALWSWKPGDKKGKTEILDAPADWNSSLSMAAIGDRMCLAYHCVANHQYPGSSRIETVFRQAK